MSPTEEAMRSIATTTDVGTEHLPTRTAKESTCDDISPGQHARDRATGPRGQYRRGAPGAPSLKVTDVGRNAAPRARLWRARAMLIVPARTRGTGPPGPGASAAAGPPGPQAERPRTWGGDGTPPHAHGYGEHVL